MSRGLRIMEFEELLSSRIHMVSLLNHGIVTEKNKLKDLMLKYTIAANKILAEHDILDLKAIFRGGKSFIIFKPTGRIACEIVADGVYQGDWVRQDKPLLLSKHGFIKSKTLGEMADYTARKGKTMFSGLKRGEIYAKRNQS